VDLRKRGLTFPEIAKVLDCSATNAMNRLRRFEKEFGDVDTYVSNRSKILAMHQKRVLDSITPDNLKKAGLRDKTVAFGVLFDKEKVESGKGPGGAGGLKIQILNFAGASNGQEPKVTQITVVKPNPEDGGGFIDAEVRPEGV